MKLGMAIGPSFNEHPQKISTMDKIKLHFYGSGHGSG